MANKGLTPPTAEEVDKIYTDYINGRIKLSKPVAEMISRMWHEQNNDIKGV